MSSDLESSPPLPAPTLEASLRNLTETLSQYSSKIFYLQISDGSRVDPKILSQEAKDEEIHAIYAWSNSYRPLPFQQDEEGFLPVVDVIKAILTTGWRGPWSYEVFGCCPYSAGDSSHLKLQVFLASDQDRDDPNIPSIWTREAVKCHRVILGKLRDERITTK